MWEKTFLKAWTTSFSWHACVLFFLIVYVLFERQRFGENGVYSKKTTTLWAMSTKNYHFFNLSENYHKFGSLFQKPQTIMWFRINSNYDRSAALLTKPFVDCLFYC